MTSSPKEVLIQQWQKELDRVQAYSNISKLGRLLRTPGKYMKAILYRKLLYPILKKPLDSVRKTYFGADIRIPLPVSTDIYLAGAKTHDSEIRLARFLMRELHPGQQYIDVGAHIGFFSMLAAELVGETGKIVSVEPAAITYEYLQKNTTQYTQVQAIQALVSKQTGSTAFFEFDTLYSEYNTILPDQYAQDAWYGSHIPTKSSRTSYTLQGLCKEFSIRPDIIKIDVEGAEFQVVSTLDNSAICPIIIMEYIIHSGTDMTHEQAISHLQRIGYQLHIITMDGKLQPADNLISSMEARGLLSDNVVFVRV